MFNYSEMTTAELVDLLFKEEDRATMEHARELIGRGEEAAALLREILVDEDYWYEGQDGDHWIVVHAVALLGAMRDEKSLPVLIEWVQHAYFANHDDAIAVYGMGLANFGETAVEPLMAKIREYRGYYWDNTDFGHCRYIFSNALTRIALRNDALRQRILDFICDLFSDPEEDDRVLLSLAVGHPVALDRGRGLKVVRGAYARKVILENIAGKYTDFSDLATRKHSSVFTDLEHEVLDFYTPEAIAERKLMRENKKEEKLYWNVSDAAAPAGYQHSEAGSLVRPGKVGRNDPCPCGSGKKYKKCCGQ